MKKSSPSDARLRIGFVPSFGALAFAAFSASLFSIECQRSIIFDLNLQIGSRFERSLDITDLLSFPSRSLYLSA